MKNKISAILFIGCLAIWSTTAQQYKKNGNEVCCDEIEVSTNHKADMVIKAEKQILSNKIVEPNIQVDYIAGELIELSDGFHANIKSTFYAAIAEVICNSAEPCLVVDFLVETNEFGTHILTYYTPVGDSNGVDYIIVDLTNGEETINTVTWANIQTLRVNTGITENYIVYVNQNNCAPPTSGNY